MIGIANLEGLPAQQHSAVKRKRNQSDCEDSIPAKTLKQSAGKSLRFAGSVKPHDGLRPANALLDSIVWEGFASRLAFPLKSRLYSGDESCLARKFCSRSDSPVLGGLSIKLPGRDTPSACSEECSEFGIASWPPSRPVMPDLSVILVEERSETLLPILRRVSELHYMCVGKFVKVEVRHRDEEELHTEACSLSSFGESISSCESSDNDEPPATAGSDCQSIDCCAEVFNSFVSTLENLKSSLDDLRLRAQEAVGDDKVPVLPEGGGSAAKLTAAHVPAVRHISNLVENALSAVGQALLRPGL